MSTVGYSTLDVIPSMKNLRSQLEAQSSAPMVAAGKSGGRKFGEAAGTEAGGRFKAKFGSAAKDAFAPLAGLVAGAAIVGLFKDAIGGASDLAESGNKVKVIFGEATSEVEKFASGGAKAFGQTKLDILNAASSFGVFGKAAGLGGHDLADFSDKLAGLSSDLASFFNTDPSQAVDAVAAGLRGESEPLRQFGVLLDDATLRQEALRLGLVATTKQALTPQQRVLAAYNVILKQTRDAQGDFARTSGGLANQQRILSAQWSEMKTQLGSKLLPAATATVKVFNNGVLPAMDGVGGAVGVAARAFGELPLPVKAATGALVAFRLASAVGVQSGLSNGFSLIGKGLEDVRLRAMLAADEYRNLRSATLETTATAHVFSPAVGRMSASLGALRLASAGAGAGLKRGLAGASALVGGPWGAAFIAGTAIVAHFWAEHQKAKQRVEDFTATLDKETGALTENSRAAVVKQLLDDGALKSAQRLGLSLTTVTDAALGQRDAMASLVAIMSTRGQLDDQAAADAIKVSNAIGVANGVVGKGAANQKLFGAAMGAAADAAGSVAAGTAKANTATLTYASSLDTARTAIRNLMSAEDKRRNANLQDRQDKLALVEQLQAAREEAAKGAKTLDINTKAGQENQHALLDLAGQWNNSGKAVKNAKGAYADMRQNFINVAISMGDTKAEAEKLAKKILDVPKTADLKFQSKGFKERMAEILAIKRELRQLAKSSIAINYLAIKNRASSGGRDGDPNTAFASGGLLRGPGTGTSDSMLIRASNGEFMQRKRAVDYYGVDFMRRLNALQVPKYASGGLIGSTTTSSSPLGSEIRGTLAIDRDGVAYIRGVARQEADGSAAARAQANRAAGIGGVPTS